MADNSESKQVIDHREIGIQQELFFPSEYSPGSYFFLPHGTRIYNKLMELIKQEYFEREFTEIITPIMFKKELWEISGHWEKYEKNMFKIANKNESNEIFCNKPMNCPSHCLTYKFKTRSYKELPLRFADFGSLHRNELTGALTGLTRVRKFSQDDAHIFCRKSQIKSEIISCINFLEKIYGIFGFEFDINLSTRPAEYIGELDLWNIAEENLKDILIEWGRPWKLNEGDGAFYGPKIDFHIKDSLGRNHQCATIQLDFNLPVRFKLEYTTENNEPETPVIIHRAIYGSIERFMAILCEHFKGKFPFWLSPRQAIIIPINNSCLEYANKIKSQLLAKKYYVDVDTTDHILKQKIVEAEISKYNYILVVGKKEMTDSTINVRYRNLDKRVLSLDQLLLEFKQNKKMFK
jgi:threonyl-tRNA synthetase